MKVIQEKLPASQIALSIEIPGETSQSTYEKVVQNLSRNANIPGFRKGKVPRQVLLQRMGNRAINATVIEELVQKGLEKAIEQESLTSLGNPKLLSDFDELLQGFKPGESLTFKASIDVPPTVTLGDYGNLSVTAEETVYDPESVDKWLKERQQQQATLVPVEERAAAMGDVAIVDYSGKSAETGEALPEVQGTDLRVDMEEGKFIAGMVEGIAGMKPEESKELTLTFPEDYPREDLAGKPVIFTVTLKELKAKELPEIDDDLAQEVSEYETIAELRENLEKRFREQAEQATKDSLNTALIDAVVKISEVDLPATMIDEEVSQILTRTFMQMQQMGIDVKKMFTPDSVPQLRENARPDAIESLKRTLVLKEIAKVEGVEADKEAVEEKIKSLREQLSDRDIDFARLEEVVTDEVLEEKTLELLKEKATLTMVPKGSLSTEATATVGQEEES